MSRPYFVPYGGLVFKPSNLLFSDVYQAPLPNPALSILDGVLTLPGSGYKFPNYSRFPALKAMFIFPYTAGTAGVYVLDLTGVTPVQGQTYKTSITTGDGSYTISPVALAADGVLAHLVTAVNASLQPQVQSGVYTTAIIGTTIQITEVNPSTQGLAISFSDSNAVITNPTPNVPPMGTVSMVQQYDSTITTGQFRLYRWALNAEQENFESSGTSTNNPSYIDIWIDETAAGFATADTQMKQWSNGLPILTGLTLAQTQAALQGMFGVPNF